MTRCAWAKARQRGVCGLSKRPCAWQNAEGAFDHQSAKVQAYAWPS